MKYTVFVLLALLSVACSSGPSQADLEATVSSLVADAVEATVEATYPGSIARPYPIGQSTRIKLGDGQEFLLTVAEIIRGDEAFDIVSDANESNDEPPEGMEYLLARIKVEYIGPEAGALELDQHEWSVMTNGRIYDFLALPAVACCLVPEFDISLHSGGTGEGWLPVVVSVDDTKPLLVWGGPGGIYFAAYE